MSSDALREKLGRVVDEAAVSPRDYGRRGYLLEVRTTAAQIVSVAEVARKEDLFLEFVTAADFTDGLQVIYNFNSFGKMSRLVVRLQLSKGQAVPSISSIYNAALWHEREVFDLFGIEFEGHPDLRRLLLPEDADFHPLLKEFGKVHSYKSTEEIYGYPDA
ncbi:MAG: NADH-quinone oxidoreductase subunit C [Deltaproteobacteria bacterium]|nr:NADH-quinone oxidoreductase subunit C [Deltaproteobacteria bacterium]MBW2071246.1 NADH-quinone oxidoreductase subunit C [Deltaproteobacteria bacterium]